MTTRGMHLAVLGIGLASAVMIGSKDRRLAAQEANRGEDAAVNLAGRKIRVDNSTGKLRDLSTEEARDLVATLTAMTTRTESVAAAPGGATLVRMDGFDHVLVGRPNEDGTIDVQCVDSIDGAVSFLSQQPKSSAKE